MTGLISPAGQTAKSGGYFTTRSMKYKVIQRKLTSRAGRKSRVGEARASTVSLPRPIAAASNTWLAGQGDLRS